MPERPLVCDTTVLLYLCLTIDERPELWTLLRVYEAGQLRKAEALAEAVRRGPRSPGNA